MDLITFLDELQSIARTGLHFTDSHYDRERYQRLQEMVQEAYSRLLNLPRETISERFAAELGYITPKMGADAAIFNEEGEILLMERADGSGWCLPCGWVDANEKPAETAVRETREETGLEVEIQRLVGVFTRPASVDNGPHTMVAIVHLCRVTGGRLNLSPEGSDLRYRHIDDVTHWHPGHEKYARAARAIWQAEEWLPAMSD